jgi:hypothetical protein
MKLIAATLLSFLAFQNPQAVASEKEGGANGGGGIGFLCNEEGKAKLYLADTYQLTKSGALNRLQNHGAIEMSDAVKVLDQKIPQKVYPHPFVRGQKVTFGFMLAHTMNGLSFEDHQLKNRTNDDNIRQIPRGCKKVQVAYQDLKRNIVQLRDQAPFLNQADWFYLKMHEALISLRNRPGMDTTAIRSQVKNIALILSNPRNFALATLNELAKRGTETKIVPPEQRKKFRTLYTAPRELLCQPTWVGERGRYAKNDFRVPNVIRLVRTAGDGRVGEHNQYTLVAGYSNYMGLYKTSQKTVAQSTTFSTESYNAFGNADGVGTFAINLTLFPDPKTKMDLSIDQYDSVTNEYLGSFEVEDAEGIHVVTLGSGYGIRCYPSERPVFRVDERSSTYDK